MANNIKKQLMISSLPPFAINRKITLKESNLNDIIRSAEELFRQIIGGNIEAKMDLGEKNAYVLADIILMEEVLAHLVKNAVDAMPNGGILRIRTNQITYQNEPGYPLRHWIAGTCAFFSVSDTGKGMDKATMQRMFEPYFTTKPGTGKGLGLAIAHSVIKAHNGCIKVESVPGKGTDIWVCLPLLQRETGQKELIPLIGQSPDDWGATWSHEYRA